MIYHHRHVFHIPGYDPVTPHQHYRRFCRQLGIFDRTWQLHSIVSNFETAESGQAYWTVKTKAPNWLSEIEFELLAWNDLVDKDATGSNPIRLFRATVTFSNLLFTGTLFRYALANLRYFAFAIVPLLEVIVLGTVAWKIAFYLTANVLVQIGAPPALEFPSGLLVFLGFFFLLMRWPGHHWRIAQALDDWSLSVDYIYGRRKDLNARLDEFATRIATRVGAGGADEIIIVGHSLGATFAVDAVARALQIDPEFGRRGSAVSIVTVGATIPKCALHPAARQLRAQIEKVVQNPSIFWLEYQARSDAISFYRFNPVTLKRMPRADQFDGKPVIRRLQIRDMLLPATFKKYRLRIMRLHYQFVSANDRRAPYDYFMMICGPLLVVKWATSLRGLIDFFHHAHNAAVDVED